MQQVAQSKPPVVARWVLPTVAAPVVLCAIGALGLAAHDAWLVPSLASAVFVQVLTPRDRGGQVWSTCIGQLVAVPAGLVAVYAARAASAPEFTSGHALDPARVVAVGIAAVLTIILQRSLKATSPAGGAVALLIALGTVPPTFHGAILLTIGTLLVTAFGEPMRLLILRAE